MKIIQFAAAAGLLIASLGAGTAASAQDRDGRPGYGHDDHRGPGWNRGRHHPHCWTEMRHHHRVRMCR